FSLLNPICPMKIYLLLTCLLFPMLLPGQTVVTFLDGTSNDPVPDVFVRTSNRDNFISDGNGQVLLNISIPTELLALHVSYENQTARISPDGAVQVLLNRKEFSLSEVLVSSFDTERPILEQAAAVYRVPESDLHRFNETSIVNAFNTKAGIRIEERAPASYRVSIRGSSLRAPFGVRNVKIYWNDIPFTAPDGTTPLNILHLSNVENTDIIKGRAGGIYDA